MRSSPSAPRSGVRRVLNNERKQWINAVFLTKFESRSVFHVAKAIEIHINRNSGEARLMRETISMRVSLSVRRVTTIIRMLEQAGWIRVFRYVGTTSVYELTWPEGTNPCNSENLTTAISVRKPGKWAAHRTHIVPHKRTLLTGSFGDRGRWEAVLAEKMGIPLADLAIPDEDLTLLCRELKRGTFNDAHLERALRLQALHGGR